MCLNSLGTVQDGETSSPNPQYNQEFYRLPAIAHVSYAFNKGDILCNANYVASNSEIGEPNQFMLILWQEQHPKSKYM